MVALRTEFEAHPLGGPRHTGPRLCSTVMPQLGGWLMAPGSCQGTPAFIILGTHQMQGRATGLLLVSPLIGRKTLP